MVSEGGSERPIELGVRIKDGRYGQYLEPYDLESGRPIARIRGVGMKLNVDNDPIGVLTMEVLLLKSDICATREG